MPPKLCAYVASDLSSASCIFSGVRQSRLVFTLSALATVAFHDGQSMEVAARAFETSKFNEMAPPGLAVRHLLPPRLVKNSARYLLGEAGEGGQLRAASITDLVHWTRLYAPRSSNAALDDSGSVYDDGARLMNTLVSQATRLIQATPAFTGTQEGQLLNLAIAMNSCGLSKPLWRSANADEWRGLLALISSRVEPHMKALAAALAVGPAARLASDGFGASFRESTLLYRVAAGIRAFSGACAEKSAPTVRPMVEVLAAMHERTATQPPSRDVSSGSMGGPEFKFEGGFKALLNILPAVHDARVPTGPLISRIESALSGIAPRDALERRALPKHCAPSVYIALVFASEERLLLPALSAHAAALATVVMSGPSTAGLAKWKLSHLMSALIALSCARSSPRDVLAGAASILTANAAAVAQMLPTYHFLTGVAGQDAFALALASFGIHDERLYRACGLVPTVGSGVDDKPASDPSTDPAPSPPGPAPRLHSTSGDARLARWAVRALAPASVVTALGLVPLTSVATLSRETPALAPGYFSSTLDAGQDGAGATATALMNLGYRRCGAPRGGSPAAYPAAAASDGALDDGLLPHFTVAALGAGCDERPVALELVRPDDVLHPVADAGASSSAGPRASGARSPALTIRVDLRHRVLAALGYRVVTVVDDDVSAAMKHLEGSLGSPRTP
jgi:hypothetical protein